MAAAGSLASSALCAAPVKGVPAAAASDRSLRPWHSPQAAPTQLCLHCACDRGVGRSTPDRSPARAGPRGRREEDQGSTTPDVAASHTPCRRPAGGPRPRRPPRGAAARGPDRQAASAFETVVNAQTGQLVVCVDAACPPRAAGFRRGRGRKEQTIAILNFQLPRARWNCRTGIDSPLLGRVHVHGGPCRDRCGCMGCIGCVGCIG